MKRQQDWLVPIFNVIVLAIFLSLLMPDLTAGRLRPLPAAEGEAVTGLIGSYSFRLAGRFAIRFLTLALAISPAVTYLGWRRLIPLRKWAGLWAFAFAALHFSLFLSDYFWRKVWGQTFVWFGLTALIILALMALTSHRPAMRLLGRNWKRLHRLVYAAGVLVVLHSVNAILFWKDIPDFDVMLLETQITGLQILLLLVLRLPVARRLIQRVFKRPKRKRKAARE